jgi:hypothetical protein
MSKFAILFIVVLVVGCDDARKGTEVQTNQETIQRNAMVVQTLRDALSTSTNAEIQAWREFLRKWPLARQRQGYAWYEEQTKFRGDVSAVTLIEDRYAFKAILDFEVSSNFDIVTFPKIRFHLAEVKRVVLPAGGATEGGVSVSFHPDQKWLNTADWKRFVESNWSFSTIGIVLVSNAPVQNIQAAIPSL